MKIQIGDYIKNTNAEGKVLGKVVNIINDDVHCQTDNWMYWPVEFVEKATDEEAMLYMLEQ
jgi:hypothetical protein